MIIEVATSAEEESGKKSARMIPRPAITANPTNGWRGALSSFINWLFAYPALARQASIALACCVGTLRAKFSEKTRFVTQKLSL